MCCCYLCGMEMASLEQLNRHLNRHAERWTRCPFCLGEICSVFRLLYLEVLLRPYRLLFTMLLNFPINGCFRINSVCALLRDIF